MSDSTPPTCPRCGAPLPADAPDGLCPRCLGALPLEAETILHGAAGRTAEPLSPEEVAPHFPQLEILECLGRGGMGVVYKARQRTLNRFVALKLLAPERVDDEKFAGRFAREAQALAALSHPNIVTIHDFGKAGGFFFLLMEFVDGANLRQLLRTQKFTPEEALAIVPEICGALQYAHDRGIVHRDIKPENILLDKEGRVKIADFGVAKMLNAEGPAASLAETQPAGTPQYMAPEQKEHRRTDHRADIYSLGVVFYEMLTGELPGKPLEAPSSRVRGMQVEVRLDEIVLRALEANPERRYQTAGEFQFHMETIAGGPTGPAPKKEHKLFHLEGINSFRSVTALRFAQVACVGFLGFLGFLGNIPAWRKLHGLLGFTGFFGLLGVAYLIEVIARRKSGGLGGLEEQVRADRPSCFSPAAIIAAGWITMCIVVVPPFLWHETKTHEFERSGPFSNLLSVLVFLVFFLPAITAPVGGTLLGWIAVSQIRRSAGKLYGMWLAVFDGLFFPLLIIDGLVGGLWFLVIKVVVIFFQHSAHGSSIDGREIDFVCLVIWLLLTVATSGVIDYLGISRVWRAVNNESHQPLTPSRGAIGSAAVASLLIAVSALWFIQRHHSRPLPGPAQNVQAAQSKRQRFEPTEGMADKTSWGVYDKSSEWNPDGWAIVTHMSLGGVALANMPGENDDFCHIKLAAGNDDEVTLNVEDLKAANTMTMTLKRDQWEKLNVNGIGYNIGYPAVWVAADQPDTSPFALIVVTHSEQARPTPAQTSAIETNPDVLRIQLQQAEEQLSQKEQERNVNAISEGDFDAAKDKVELLKAELGGDPGEVTKVRLAAAQRDLERDSRLFKTGLIGGLEYDDAKDKVQLLTAELNGDSVQIARTSLTAAQRRLEDKEGLFKTGIIPTSDYEAAKDEVAIAEAKLKEAEAAASQSKASLSPGDSPGPAPPTP
jgi:tRNA A-37 threonylcarbamoyl transferase component Bud32